MGYKTKAEQEAYNQGYKDGLNEKDTACDEAIKLCKGKKMTQEELEHNLMTKL